jgi:spermidine synthase
MLVHPPLFAHPNPKRVLIIGGGDGGSVREALRHAGVERVTLVEIDGLVVETCRKYFPALTSGLDDPRAEVLIQDGFAYLDDHQGQFDVILVDSTDPVNLAEDNQPTPAAVLFTPDFYGKIQRALRPGGIAAFQSENPFYSGPVLRDMHRDLRAQFGKVMLYLANVPTYPGGLWSFTVASDQVDLHDLRIASPPEWTRQLKYFQPAMFPGILVLPRYVEQLISG